MKAGLVRRIRIPLFLLAFWCLAQLWSPPSVDPRGIAQVRKVTDGDTLVVRVGGTNERVRLLGIDTPETHGHGGLRECYGLEASQHLAQLLPRGTEVRLVRDVQARDHYDRLLAYVYRDTDDLFVNEALVRDGYAIAKHYSPNVAHRDDFDRAQIAAKRADAGLWGTCGSADVALPKD